jgi:hypothetical protein
MVAESWHPYGGVSGNDQKGLFRKIDSEHLFKLQNHMVTLGENVDGARGS